MHKKTYESHDGITLNYAISDIKDDKPWIALIFPFGLKIELAETFIAFFNPHYNIVSWETRSILEDSERKVAEQEFSIENHLYDMHGVLSQCPSEKFIVVGYCSGAGLALAAANRYPHLISQLILVHGEYTMLQYADCTTQFASEIDSLLSLAGKDEDHLRLVFDKIKADRFEDTGNRPDGIDMPFTEQHFLRRHAANYMSYKQTDFEHLAQWVSHKTFLMSGERDAQANVKSTEKIASLMPQAEVYIDPEADHYGILREESNTLITIWNYLCEHYAA